MKTWHVIILIIALLAGLSAVAAEKPENSKADVPKYDLRTETTFKGTVVEMKDRHCAVSGGVGSHLILKVGDKTIEVHLAASKFVKTYELVFNKGDEIEVIGSKVKFEDVDTIFAREIHRGNDTFVFRDKDGKPIW
jgi:DNA/RNA endonuclease YhcR with UshA esterase domain